MTCSVKLLASLAALCAASGALAAAVGVQESPTMTAYWSNGTGGPQIEVGTVAFTVDANGNFVAGQQTFTWGQGAQQDSISINYAAGNFDPVITIGVGFVDADAPSVFSFAVSSPLAPAITGPANYKLDLSGSFADGASDGGSMGLGTASYGIMDGQLDFASFAGIGGAIASFPAGGSTPWSFPTVTGTVNCDVPCNDFGIFLSARGSGNGDAMSFTGRLEINPVPAPGALWLMVTAIGVLGRYLRRR